MSEALQAYVGKKCVITLSAVSGTSLTGVVKAVAGNWMTVQTGKPGKEKTEMVSVEYITRISEK